MHDLPTHDGKYRFEMLDLLLGDRKIVAGSALRVLLVGCNGNGNRVLREFRGRRAVHHRVRVLDADSIGSVMVLHDVHHGIVGSAMGPIALPFEHDGHGRDRLRAGLNGALHRVVVSKLTHVAAAILHDVDLVAVMNRLYCRKPNTDFCPKTGNENLLASAFFDRFQFSLQFAKASFHSFGLVE
jgi:hypothetical protein